MLNVNFVQVPWAWQIFSLLSQIPLIRSSIMVYYFFFFYKFSEESENIELNGKQEV